MKCNGRCQGNMQANNAIMLESHKFDNWRNSGRY